MENYVLLKDVSYFGFNLWKGTVFFQKYGTDYAVPYFDDRFHPIIIISLQFMKASPGNFLKLNSNVMISTEEKLNAEPVG
jgi:hypothetical protein